MFAPDPTRLDGWIKAPGWREDGTRIDVVHGGPPSDAPRFANPWYSRWRKIDERIANDDYAGYRMDLASMYCRSYNDSRPAERPRLATFELVSVDRAVGSPNVGVPVMTDRLIWTQAC